MSDKRKVVVACTNASGEADMYVCSVDITKDQYNLGVHYDLAKEMAIKEGYEEPFVCFDEYEQKNIARQIPELRLPIPFTMIDESFDASKKISGTVQISSLGVGINLNGYSDCNSQDDKGNIAYLEYWNGEVKLLAYADINKEGPTSIINLDSAKNECRIETIYFNELQSMLSQFDTRIELSAEFSEQSMEDGLNVMQATESYFSDQSFDLSSLTPLKGECKQVKELSRPYVAISEQQQNELMNSKTDFYKTNGGLVVTFDAADGGYALMPLNEEEAKKILANQ